MRSKIIVGKGDTAKGGQRGNQMWGAHSLEAGQKNAAISHAKKKKKSKT